MPVGHAQHASRERSVHVALERRLDLHVIADLVREVRRDLRQRLHLPRRSVHGAEDHHQRLRERRGRVLRPRRQLARRIPTSARGARRSRTASPASGGDAEPAEQRERTSAPESRRRSGPARTPSRAVLGPSRAAGAGPATTPSHRSARASTTPGKHARARRTEPASKACGTSITAGASCAAAAARLRGNARNADTERLDETGRRERARQRQQRAATGNRKWTSGSGRAPGTRSRNAWNVSHSLAKPLRGGSPEIATAPTRKNSAGPRHPPQQAPEFLDLPRAGRHDHASGAEEQQSLEDRVVQHVVEAGGDADRGQSLAVHRERHHAGAQPEQDDADVLDAVVGEQPLEVVLHQRIQHAENRRERPDQRGRGRPTTAGTPEAKCAERGRCRRCPS